MQSQREVEMLLDGAAGEATDSEQLVGPASPAEAGSRTRSSLRHSKSAAIAMTGGLLACLLLGAAFWQPSPGQRVRGQAQHGSQLNGLGEDAWEDDDWDDGGDDDWGASGDDWDSLDVEEPAPAPSSTTSRQKARAPASAPASPKVSKVKSTKKLSRSPKMKVDSLSGATAADDEDGGWEDDEEVAQKPKQARRKKPIAAKAKVAKAAKADDGWADDDDDDVAEPSAPKKAKKVVEDDGWADAADDDEAPEEDDEDDEDAGGEEDYEVEAQPDDSDCSDSGHDCTKTRCCSQPGEQCYSKNSSWAVCRAGCLKGRHVTEEDGKTWSCEEIGDRSPGKAPKCSAFGENCAKSHCCRDIGLQCYEKHPGYATCKPSCSKAMDVSDKDNKPWSCKELGTRRPGRAEWTADECTEDWSDCRKSKCCKRTGSTCFARDKEWASCQEKCLDTSWSCKRLGPPMPMLEEDALVHVLPKMKASSWVSSKCSAFGSNCLDTKCCEDPGAKCFRKNSKHASCKATCVKGPDPADDDSDHWSCDEIGPATPGKPAAHVLQGGNKQGWVDEECSDTGGDCHKSKCCKEEGFQCLKGGDGKATCRASCSGCKALGARTPREWNSESTLFCFAVVTKDTYEVDIMREQLKRRAGIFACEEQAMMSEENAYTLDDELGGEMVSFESAPVGTSRDGTAGNSELFMNVWAAVKRLGKWRNTDWTIKTDPDAVILPDRLRMSLAKVKEDTHIGDSLFAYVKTCHKNNGMKNMMFGALEALTKVAVEKYFEHIEQCKQLDWQSWGEDLFMMKCLDNLGAIGMDQFEVVSDQLCNGVDCSDPNAGAFHPMKSLSSWSECFDKAIR